MSSPYAHALEDIRSTAKWLVASLTAAGFVSIAGFGLDRLTAIDATHDTVRLAFAAACLIAAAGVVAWLIGLTSRILTATWVTLAALSDAQFTEIYEGGEAIARDVLEAIEDVKVELYTHVSTSVAELHGCLEKSHDRLAHLLTNGGARPGAPIAQANDVVQIVDDAARRVVSYANYWLARRQLARLRTSLAAGAAAVLVLAGAYVQLTHPPVDPQPVRVEIVKGP